MFLDSKLLSQVNENSLFIYRLYGLEIQSWS